jgi:5-methylcytosine-specific restriction endonuclease McrA
MSYRPPSPEEQIRFLRQFQRLLDEGSFVSTYKFALLHAIADLCIAKGDNSGAPLELSTEDLAEHFVQLYWPQTVPFSRGRRGGVLRQNTGRQATVVREVGERYQRYDGSLSSLQHDAPEWRRLLSEVGATVQHMPLWKLQTVGTERVEFLYPNLDRRAAVTLNPRVAYCFRAFYPMIKEMVEGAWLHHVRRQNPEVLGPEADLRTFLFGGQRASLERFRTILSDHQRGRCFYCEKGIRTVPHVDHFIPWRRYPLDLGHNLVLAHANCNERKGDRLAAEEHLAKWSKRNTEHGETLSCAFDERELRHDFSSTSRVAEWAYEQLRRTSGRVWVRGSELRLLSEQWRESLHASS